MPIVNSHYVPLQEPYPIIYYGGTVAIQTGTLIVVNAPGAEVEGRMGNRFSSRMTTSSHPVVTYGNKFVSEPHGEWRQNMWSEGVVWDYVQLKDVYTFCFTKQKQVNLDTIQILTTTIRIKEALTGTYKFRISTVLKELENLGIKRPNALSIQQPTRPLHVIVIKNLEKDLVLITGLGALCCCVQMEKDVEKMVTEIRRQVADYLMLLKPKEVELSYETDVQECQPIVDALNTQP